MKVVNLLRYRLESLRRTPRIFERRGARWELDPKDWLDRKLIADLPYEKKQLARFLPMAEAAGVSRFFDIGANWGLYAVLAARALPNLAIDCFEPVAATRRRLDRNLALNDLTDRVTVHQVACSDSAGEAEIAVSPDSLCISSLSASAEETEARHLAPAETVRLARFDDLFALGGERLLFKVDVEGHEVAALTGMARTLRENACFLQVETRARNRSTVEALMAEAGYRLTGEIKEDLYFERREA